jgi:hypothetical protein
MTKEELVLKLKECNELGTEDGHMEADELLIEFINDPDVKKAFNDLSKWYA